MLSCNNAKPWPNVLCGLNFWISWFQLFFSPLVSIPEYCLCKSKMYFSLYFTDFVYWIFIWFLHFYQRIYITMLFMWRFSESILAANFVLCLFYGERFSFIIAFTCVLFKYSSVKHIVCDGNSSQEFSHNHFSKKSFQSQSFKCGKLFPYCSCRFCIQPSWSELLGSNPSGDMLLLKKSSLLRTTLAISKTLFPSWFRLATWAAASKLIRGSNKYWDCGRR